VIIYALLFSLTLAVVRQFGDFLQTFALFFVLLQKITKVAVQYILIILLSDEGSKGGRL
tara:strand:+ start:2934 stop:3110 length:177 start_codon:yes stop_codon:yes gene_type:complete